MTNILNTILSTTFAIIALSFYTVGLLLLFITFIGVIVWVSVYMLLKKLIKS